MSKLGTKVAILAATLAATNSVAGANPQYTSTQEPQGKTQTIDAPAKEANLTSKDLVKILDSIEFYQFLSKKRPERAEQLSEEFLSQVMEKGTPNIDNTLTLSDKSLKAILETTLQNFGLNDKDIAPAMKYFDALSTKQSMQMQQVQAMPAQQAPTAGEDCIRGVVKVNGKPIDYTISRDGDCKIDGKKTNNPKLLKPVYDQLKPNDNSYRPYISEFCKNYEQLTSQQAQTAGKDCLRGVVNANGHTIRYTIDKDGGCITEGLMSENLNYLMPSGIKQGSLDWRNMMAQIKGAKLQHYVYQQLKDNPSPYIQNFCKNHTEEFLPSLGLEIDKNGNLRQTNPRYDEKTIQQMQMNNTLKKAR